MDAVGQAAGHDFDQLWLKLVKALEKLCEIVDQQKDIPERYICQLAPLTHFAERCHAVDAALAEKELAFFNDLVHLPYHAAHLIALRFATKSSHVRSLLEDAQ